MICPKEEILITNHMEESEPLHRNLADLLVIIMVLTDQTVVLICDLALPDE